MLFPNLRRRESPHISSPDMFQSIHWFLDLKKFNSLRIPLWDCSPSRKQGCSPTFTALRHVREGPPIWAVFGTVKGVIGSWTRARRVVWFIALVYDTFATGSPRTLISDLGRKKRAKSPIRALDLLAEPRCDHHAYKHLKWEASKRERVMLWMTEWGICNFRGPWHPATSPPGWDVPAQVVLAPNAPCWRETTGQTFGHPISHVKHPENLNYFGCTGLGDLALSCTSTHPSEFSNIWIQLWWPLVPWSEVLVQLISCFM